MAAANLSTHQPINFAQSLDQKGPFTGCLPERAGQTFKGGTPVMPFTTGGSIYVQAWDGATIANAILGIAYGQGSNLPSNGAGAPTQYNPVGPPRAIATYGSVPNQSSAVNIAPGTPATDGRTLYMQANGDNIFEAVYDNSNGLVAADYTPTSSMIGANLGMTQDPNGLWYVDANKTGAAAILQIVGANPNYGFGQVNGVVRFIFLAASRAVPSVI